MATQQQRSETTRAQLLMAFRTSLLELGLEATTTQRILAETGLSKGALYHHYQSKKDIIQAIYEEESRGAIDRALSHVQDITAPLERLKAALMAWTREVQDPAVSKILFDIGPSALGLKKAKEIEDRFSLVQIETHIKQAVAEHELAPVDTKLISVLLNALVAEASLHTLRSGTEAAPILEATIEAVLSAFRPDADKS